jgi:hypothetical protein
MLSAPAFSARQMERSSVYPERGLTCDVCQLIKGRRSLFIKPKRKCHVKSVIGMNIEAWNASAPKLDKTNDTVSDIHK